MRTTFDEFLNEKKKLKFKSKKLEKLLKDVFYKGWKSAEVLWNDKNNKDNDWVQDHYKKSEQEAVDIILNKNKNLESEIVKEGFDEDGWMISDNNVDVKKTYIIHTDLLDDFQKEHFLSLLERMENMGCTIS